MFTQVHATGAKFIYYWVLHNQNIISYINISVADP